jgi:hypothetical protein
MRDYQVISAVLDNEEFDPQELSLALAEREGRELFIDLLTLRKLVQPDDLLHQTPSVRPVSKPHRMMRVGLAAAALLLSIFAGYQIRERAEVLATSPPAPTLVIDSETPWQPLSDGGSR